MGLTTPGIALPYPVGTDRVMDGDNAIQALAERIEARMAWGNLGYAESVADQPGFGTTPSAMGNTQVNAVIKANRVTRVTLHGTWQVVTATAHMYQLIYMDGAEVRRDVQVYPVANGYAIFNTIYVVRNLAAGSHAFTGYAVTGVGTANLSKPAFLLVEDVGPATIT